MAFTRRTHIVRISDAKPGDPPSDAYIDVEVLDAISFAGEGGKEMVLNMPQENVKACIKDSTGGEHGKEPGQPTRLSHMKRIVSEADPSQMLDIEVIDILSFRDTRGTEWILDMNSTNGQPSVFNSTEGTGSSKSTRRTHNEKVRIDPKDTKSDSGFMTIERCDSIAFRTVRGEEMIVDCPSSDDPESGKQRASTFITSPRDYDPNNPDGPVPPKNEDENVYVAFVKDADGFLTGKTKISQGPFWWIRKISAGDIIVVQIDIKKKNFPTGTEGSGPKPVIMSGIKLDGNFGFTAKNVDDDFNKGSDPGSPTVKIMPTKAPTKPPDPSAPKPIDLKEDKFWWTGHGNDKGEDEWTVLLFFNIAKIEKDDKDGELQVTLKLPKLRKAGTGVAGIGHYLWAVSGGDDHVFVPIHPPPDATNAFEPYPYGDAAATNYISLWNTDSTSDAASYARSGSKASFDSIGFSPTSYPAENGALGFFTGDGAAAWAEASNEYSIAHSIDTPPTILEALTIDFSAGPPPKNPELTVTVTVMDFIGKTSFDYDNVNKPGFDPPTDKLKNVTRTFAHAARFDGSIIRVLVKKNSGTKKQDITINEAAIEG